MGKDPARRARQRQKKLEKQRRKRRNVEKARAAVTSGLPPVNDTLPLHGCWVDDGGEYDMGLSTVAIARKAGKGYYLALFLIDRWGMGLKDCFGWAGLTLNELQDHLEEIRTRTDLDLKPAELTYAQQLIWGGVAYGQKNGFRIPAEFRRWKPMVGKLPPGVDVPEDLFGKDGSPLIVGDPREIARRTLEPFNAEQELARKDRRYMVTLPTSEAAEALNLDKKLWRLYEPEADPEIPPGKERVLSCTATLIHEDYASVLKCIRADMDTSVEEEDPSGPYTRLTWQRDRPRPQRPVSGDKAGAKQRLGTITVTENMLTVQAMTRGWLATALAVIFQSCQDEVALIDVEFQEPTDEIMDAPGPEN